MCLSSNEIALYFSRKISVKILQRSYFRFGKKILPESHRAIMCYNQCFGTGSGSGTFWVEAEAIFENLEAEALVKKILEAEAI